MGGWWAAGGRAAWRDQHPGGARGSYGPEPGGECSTFSRITQQTEQNFVFHTYTLIQTDKNICE